MRPILRPGLRPLRRDTRTWQLGLDWAGVAVIADRPATAAVMSALDGFHDVDGVVGVVEAQGYPREAVETALHALVDCGAVVDADETRPREIPDTTWAAWSLMAGPHGTAGDIAASRTRTVVGVAGSGLVATEVRRLLPLSNLTPTDRLLDAHLVIAAADTEPTRDRSDGLMHKSAPHLWAYVRDLVGVVGPLVVPGSTACLRCVDASRADLDRCWPLLVEASGSRPPRPAPAEPIGCALIAAWAVQEAALWASGLRPQTVDAVVELPIGYGPVTRQTFEPHPACGCGWPVWHDTMGA